jgi:methionyl-tRNA synthetase
MIAKAGGTLPAPGPFSDTDTAILAAADALLDKARVAMRTQALHQVLSAAWAVVGDGDRYFAGEAPWALAKTDPARQGTVLYTTAEVIRQIAIVAQPFMPVAAARLLDLLGVAEDRRGFAHLGACGRLEPGTALPPPAPVFPRFEEEGDGEPKRTEKQPKPAAAMKPKAKAKAKPQK